MAKNDDPTVTSSAGEPTEGARRARPNSEADDYAGSHTYKDVPAEDKPGPDSVVQVQVLPEG